jgi:hypothetical protein
MGLPGSSPIGFKRVELLFGRPHFQHQTPKTIHLAGARGRSAPYSETCQDDEKNASHESLSNKMSCITLRSTKAGRKTAREGNEGLVDASVMSDHD